MRLVADNFGLKIGIEGEKEFKKALSEINQSFKVLGSEMKLVSSQFDANDKSIQALSARNTVLNKEIDAQRQKIETLRAALQNASESFGENDRRTQNWQIQLNNAEAALNGMERELSANERTMESLSQQETEAADATERLSQEISRQEDELAGMKRAYSNAVLEYGKGSSEAKELEGRISQLSGELRENRERMKDAGDVAEDFGDSLEDASNGADKLGSGLSVATVAMGNLISSGIQAALSGIQELGSAIWNLDEATEEYRVAQGKLTTAFEVAGYSGDAAQKSYTEFYKILGDTDTATEASQLLAQLAQNEQDRSTGTVWISNELTIEGELNRSCTADIIMGMHADTYYYAGGFDDWFLDTDSSLTAEDLAEYFKATLFANGGDMSGDVDALTEPGSVTLRSSDGAYPSSGQLITKAAACSLSGTGRVAATSEYTAGVTAIEQVETSTSDDLEEWSAWQAIGTSGELQSPNRQYIRFRVTLATEDTSRTPKLLEIQLHDIPKAPYEKLGFARPVVLDANGAWEAVLENAFDIVVTSEVNGADTMEFYLPFHDPKRAMLDNEKQVQIVNDIYRIRTLTDTKDADGRIVTQVYAEAAFYDLSFSEEKETVDFNADTADAPMRHALEGTGWSVGTVNVTTLRTWQCTEKNALSILRATQNIHGGDLIFDCPNRLVHLLTFGGNDSGALFAYRKNLKSIERVVDTRSLVTRLYAYGKDGMTFASINGGKDYVEDFSYTTEVRISTLDCSNFTNPYQMLEYTQMRLAEYAQPRVSYVLSAMDLSALTGYEHEAWALGDIVTVDDKDLNLSVKTRVVRRQYNLQEPWKTVLELSTTLRELGDSSAQWDKAADVLASTDVIDRQEVKDLVPFNHLRNSRADNGMNYWTNSGFEVDAENGVSGTASFKAEGVLGMTKSLTQTVYPASRRSYTFSAQIASEDLQKGPSGQVGIEVTFEYEDGSTETRFIDLF